MSEKVGKHAIVVLDETGSMRGQEERVTTSLNEYVDGLPKGTRLAVFKFDSVVLRQGEEVEADEGQGLPARQHDPAVRRHRQGHRLREGRRPRATGLVETRTGASSEHTLDEEAHQEGQEARVGVPVHVLRPSRCASIARGAARASTAPATWSGTYVMPWWGAVPIGLAVAGGSPNGQPPYQPRNVFVAEDPAARQAVRELKDEVTGDRVVTTGGHGCLSGDPASWSGTYRRSKLMRRADKRVIERELAEWEGDSVRCTAWMFRPGGRTVWRCPKDAVVEGRHERGETWFPLCRHCARRRARQYGPGHVERDL